MYIESLHSDSIYDKLIYFRRIDKAMEAKRMINLKIFIRMSYTDSLLFKLKIIYYLKSLVKTQTLNNGTLGLRTWRNIQNFERNHEYIRNSAFLSKTMLFFVHLMYIS